MAKGDGRITIDRDSQEIVDENPDGFGVERTPPPPSPPPKPDRGKKK